MWNKLGFDIYSSSKYLLPTHLGHSAVFTRFIAEASSDKRK